MIHRADVAGLASVSPERALIDQMRAKGAKLGAAVARSIQDEIIRLGWPLGHSLGTERDLLDRFCVSRATLREAIRQIEGQGLAEMRCGTGGGLVVAAPARTVAMRTLGTYLALIDVSLEEVFEACAILEGLAARLAAERLTDIGVEKLMTCLSGLRSQSVPDLKTSIAQGMELCRLMADLSGNPAITMLIETFERYESGFVQLVLTDKVLHETDMLRRFQVQKQLIEAVLKRDGRQAGRLAREYVEAMGASLSKAFDSEAPHSLALLRARKDDSDSASKLGQRIAVGIASDIRGLPLAAGQLLGREPELQSRYGVSRAVLREALRILELHGFARTRRGNGGGVVAGVPDPGYTADCVALYLRFVHFSPASVVEICQELQVEAIGLSVQRATESEVATLRRILEMQASTTADEPGVWVEVATAFHHVLIDLGHNRVISVFIRALIAASLDSGMFVASPAAKTAYDASHAAVVRAIEKRDAELARKRMTEHIAVAMRQGKPPDHLFV